MLASPPRLPPSTREGTKTQTVTPHPAPASSISLVEEPCGFAALPLRRQKRRVCLFCQSGDKILFFVIPEETNQINSG